MARREPTRRQRVTGAALLNNVSAITLKLDNGTKVHINLADEIAIPEGKSSQWLAKELEKTTGSLAFWTVQVARAKSKAVKRRAKYENFRAKKAWAYRRKINDESAFSTNEFGIITDAVEADTQVAEKRQLVDSAEQHAILIDQIRDCVRQRMFALGKLLDARKGHQ